MLNRDQIVTTNIAEMIEEIIADVDLGIPVCLRGEPGLGKTQGTYQAADRMGRVMRVIRAPYWDAVDLRGMPSIENGLTHWRPPAELPQPGCPDTVLLVDELNRAPISVQNALMQLVEERRMGAYTLPDNVGVVLALNPSGKGTSSSVEALSNRMIHLHVVPDLQTFSSYAIKARFHAAVIGYTRFNSAALHAYKPGAVAFPSPRTWEFTSKILYKNLPDASERRQVCGAIGEEHGLPFLGWYATYKRLPNMDAIVNDPANAPVPTEAAVLFAVSAELSRRMTEANIGRILTYLDRCPDEFDRFAVVDATRREPALQHTPEYTAWCVAHPN